MRVGIDVANREGRAGSACADVRPSPFGVRDGASASSLRRRRWSRRGAVVARRGDHGGMRRRRTIARGLERLGYLVEGIALARALARALRTFGLPNAVGNSACLCAHARPTARTPADSLRRTTQVLVP
jgi:hypothetical protein